MLNPRFMFIVVAIALGFSYPGCSQSHSSPESVPPAEENNGQTVAEEGSDQAKRHVRWWRDESIVAELELSDDQVRTIEQLMTDSSGDSNQQRQKERQLSLRYLRGLAQDPYDPALAEGVSERLIEVLSSKHRRRIQNVRTLRDILTQEQWTKLWELAPRVFQISGFRVLRGPKISVPDPEASPTPTPTP